jgi:hypothetical protein
MKKEVARAIFMTCQDQATTLIKKLREMPTITRNDVSEKFNQIIFNSSIHSDPHPGEEQTVMPHLLINRTIGCYKNHPPCAGHSTVEPQPPD